MNNQAWAMYGNVPEHVREDIVEACIWARSTLIDQEGKGHIFQIVGNHDCEMCCSFAKLEWSGDHSGPWMAGASEAIVAAVCGYLSGC